MKSIIEQQEIIRDFMDTHYPAWRQKTAMQPNQEQSQSVHLREDATEEEKAAALEVGGARWNAGKNRLDLLPPDAIWVLGMVYTVGSKKYKDRNWEKGMPYSVCLQAAQRHLLKWMMGETNDEGEGGTGLPHLAHAAWNCLALLAYELRGMTEFDDRFKLPPELTERLCAM